MNKLFAVGTKESNPENWKAWDGVELVTAKTSKQAVKMCGLWWQDNYNHTQVAEVDMTKAQHVMKQADYIDDW